MPIAVALITLMVFCACDKQKPEPEQGGTTTDTVPQAPPAPTNADLIIGHWRADLVNGSTELLVNTTHEWEFHADSTGENIGIIYGDTIIQHVTYYEVTTDTLMMVYENEVTQYYRLNILNDSELEAYSETEGPGHMLYITEHFYRMN